MKKSIVAVLLLLAAPAQAQQNDAPNVARAALQFLDRTDLKGAEAETMVRVRQFLADVATGRLVASPPAQEPPKGN